MKINFMLEMFTVVEEKFVVSVEGEPVIKMNTGILKCQVYKDRQVGCI